MAKKSNTSIFSSQAFKFPNKYLLLVLIILSALLLASYGPREYLQTTPAEKIFDSKSSIGIRSDVTQEQLQDFYSFAVQEYSIANYGSSKDLLLGITQKTDKIPMAWYYLSQIYLNVYPYSKEQDKLKICLLNIVKSNLNIGIKQSAYDDLAKIDPNNAIEYGKKAVALQSNIFSKYILLTAYYNAYEKTHDEMYKKEFEKNYDDRVKIVFANSKTTPWIDGALALR